ncbi:ABC transporter permease [Spirochaetia bacterium]|nr:ABC transporter permease [Spirochaetia bacterium]
MVKAAALHTVTLRERQNRENLAGLAFLLPSLIGFVGFIVLPMLFSLYLSFHEWSMISGFKGIKFVGLENFRIMPGDVKFKIAMYNTLRYTILTVPISIILGLIIAVLIHDYVYGKNFIKIAVFLPYISSLVAITVVWKVLLNPTRGPVNMFLMTLGVQNPPGWFASTKWAIVGVSLETIWLTIGYNVVLYMAAFTGISSDLYDAASIDGCGGLRRVLYITIPGAGPTTFFLTIMALINSFKVFDQVSIIQAGSPSADASLVIAYQIYLQAFQYYKMGYASAMSWVLFAIIMVITLVQWHFDKSQ